MIYIGIVNRFNVYAVSKKLGSIYKSQISSLWGDEEEPINLLNFACSVFGKTSFPKMVGENGDFHPMATKIHQLNTSKTCRKRQKKTHGKKKAPSHQPPFKKVSVSKAFWSHDLFYMKFLGQHFPTRPEV